jgi:hypothetical protein
VSAFRTFAPLHTLSSSWRICTLAFALALPELPCMRITQDLPLAPQDTDLPHPWHCCSLDLVATQGLCTAPLIACAVLASLDAHLYSTFDFAPAFTVHRGRIVRAAGLPHFTVHLALTAFTSILHPAPPHPSLVSPSELIKSIHLAIQRFCFCFCFWCCNQAASLMLALFWCPFIRLHRGHAPLLKSYKPQPLISGG